MSTSDVLKLLRCDFSRWDPLPLGVGVLIDLSPPETEVPSVLDILPDFRELGLMGLGLTLSSFSTPLPGPAPPMSPFFTVALCSITKSSSALVLLVSIFVSILSSLPTCCRRLLCSTIDSISSASVLLLCWFNAPPVDWSHRISSLVIDKRSGADDDIPAVSVSRRLASEF